MGMNKNNLWKVLREWNILLKMEKKNAKNINQLLIFICITYNLIELLFIYRYVFAHAQPLALTANSTLHNSRYNY